MPTDIEGCVEEYQRNRHHIHAWCESVRQFFEHHPTLTLGGEPVVHSIRSRLKDKDHLREKLRRKEADGVVITPETLLSRITDLGGVRVLHLFQLEFGRIHEVISEQISRGDWSLFEAPVAYTWDPESKVFFESFGLETRLKESHYTSIHYVLKPRPDSPLTCELQVRTLFEEAWGEIDHNLNYPEPNSIAACREQLRVLAKLVGASTRLADSIWRASRSR